MNREIFVKIICDESIPLCAYHLQLGLEEEGVPSALTVLPVTNIAEVAKNAANQSRLQVGIAANTEKIAIHHQKLPMQSPILSYRQNEKNARLAGKNAARLVKGLPFDLGTEL